MNLLRAAPRTAAIIFFSICLTIFCMHMRMLASHKPGQMYTMQRPRELQPGDLLRKDLNGDGRIDGNDQKAYPNIQRDRPTAYFGLNGYVSWKGIDLGFLFQASTGRKDFWLNAFNNVNFGTSRYATTWDHWNNPWSVENRGGAWPRMGGSGNNTSTTTFWLDDMSYLRLKNLQLGYTFPQKIFKKLGITSLRIAGSAENLLTITSYRGLDPGKGWKQQ